VRLRSSALPPLLIWPALWAGPLGKGLEPPIQSVEIDSVSIAITFDACPTSSKAIGFDRAVFDTLTREQVPATVFVSGRWVDQHAGAMADLVHSPLIEFGDHSYDHPHMRTLPPAQMAMQIDRTEAALARYGKRGVAFRPPYGEWNPGVLEVLQRKQLPVVLWDVVSGDPSDKISAQGIVRNVMTRTRPGSIIVFHINGRGWRTADALPLVISQLRERGFRFVPLSELLAGRKTGAPAPAPAPVPILVSSGPPDFDPLVPAR
jgi:peptidoglycan/xylan/chitin deacetylase (PgdA/CDA1 family)